MLEEPSPPGNKASRPSPENKVRTPESEPVGLNRNRKPKTRRSLPLSRQN
ncbi:unnamed protein product, partial [Brassica rapa]